MYLYAKELIKKNDRTFTFYLNLLYWYKKTKSDILDKNKYNIYKSDFLKIKSSLINF